jgi:hypothetical protein
MTKNSQDEKRKDYFKIFFVTPMIGLAILICFLIFNQISSTQKLSTEQVITENNIHAMERILESDNEFIPSQEMKFDSYFDNVEDSIKSGRLSSTIFKDGKETLYQEKLTLLKLKKFEKIMQNKKTQSDIMKIK